MRDRVEWSAGKVWEGCLWVLCSTGWLVVELHSALSSALFGSQGGPSSPALDLLWAGCSSPSLSPPSRLQPPQSCVPPSPVMAGRHGECLAQLLPSLPYHVPRPALISALLSSPLLTDVPGLALGRPRPLCPAAELHEHFCQLVWLYAADPLADEARPCPL